MFARQGIVVDAVGKKEEVQWWLGDEEINVRLNG
jgi:hypothetical protein